MTGIKKVKRNGGAVRLLVIAFFTVTLLIPLSKMLLSLKDINVVSGLTAPKFKEALTGSLTVSVTATLISVAFSFILAFLLSRAGRFRPRGFFSVLFVLPMLIPSISHGTGMVILFGQNGIFTRLFGIGGAGFYGFTGIVAGSVMYSFPVAFLMLSDILSYEDFSPYEAAKVLGVGRVRQFFRITVPFLRKPMISVFFAVFTMIVTDYGVPITLGGKFKTLPSLMYYDVIERQNFAGGSLIGLVLLIPALLAFIIDIIGKNTVSSAAGKKPFTTKVSRVRSALTCVFCAAVGLLIILPLVTFVVLTFIKQYPINMTVTVYNIQKALRMSAGKYLLNSLAISAAVAAAGTTIAVITAYFTARRPGGASRLLHLIAITSLAVPGLVLGLSYALFFSGSFIYSTFAILILVNTIHFFASPYLMMYNTFGKLNPNLEAVGATLSVSRTRVFFDVLLPQSAATIVEMACYFFVNSMMTISAVSFLRTSSTKPLALMIPQFENEGLISCIAFVSVVILLVNIIIKVAAATIKRCLRTERTYEKGSV